MDEIERMPRNRSVFGCASNIRLVMYKWYLRSRAELGTKLFGIEWTWEKVISGVIMPFISNYLISPFPANSRIMYSSIVFPLAMTYLAPSSSLLFEESAISPASQQMILKVSLESMEYSTRLMQR